MAPAIFALCAVYAPLNLIDLIILVIVSTGFTVFAAQSCWKTAIEIRNYRLGFDGERMVGQELNQTLPFGCQIFHDVHLKKPEKYNIDHVIVAPSGVYVVETKARRKAHTTDSHVVRYDGQKLVFPEGEDVKYLDQAQRNAKSLSAWIHETTGERVWVEPILTFPGWFVKSLGRTKAEVQVLHPKRIADFVRDGTSHPHLSPQLFKLICGLLTQKNVIIRA